MWLIGQEWKCGNTWSGLILIGRGLDLNELGKCLEKAKKVSSYYSVLRVQEQYAPLAQLVEQLTLNQWVHGSSP